MSEYTVVYFKAIKRGFSIPAVLADFTVAGHEITIRFYGVLIALGFLLALIAITRLARQQNIDLNQVFDMVIWGTAFGVIGARAMYVAFTWDYYSQNLSEIWRIHDGGMAIYGGVLLGIVGAWLTSKIEKSNIRDGLDLAGVGFLLGQAVGRWGNFFNQEAFGTNTDLPWGMMSTRIREYITTHQDFFAEHGLLVSPDKYVHPTFFYESLWCLIGFLLLYRMFQKHRKYRGQIILAYMAWYGFERMLVENLRTDSLYVGNTNLRISVLISAVLFLAGGIPLLINHFRYKDKPVLEPYPEPEEE